MKVILKFSRDDATGEWGVAPKQSIEAGFNAFWTGATGIFHDVFEHYYEDNHKYFRGRRAHNIAGEVIAMGHLCYYVNKLAVNREAPGGGHVDTYKLYNDTLYMMTEYMDDGYAAFGNGWECPVPKQSYTGIYNVEHAINEHLAMLRNYYEEKEIPKDKRIKLSEVASCYRWGYKKAERLVSYTDHNIDTLNQFIAFWTRFCKQNDAEYAAMIYREIIFNITGGPNLKWNAWFIPDMGVRLDIEDMPEAVHYKQAENYIIQ